MSKAMKYCRKFAWGFMFLILFSFYIDYIGNYTGTRSPWYRCWRKMVKFGKEKKSVHENESEKNKEEEPKEKDANLLGIN